MQRLDSGGFQKWKNCQKAALVKFLFSSSSHIILLSILNNYSLKSFICLPQKSERGIWEEFETLVTECVRLEVSGCSPHPPEPRIKFYNI